MHKTLAIIIGTIFTLTACGTQAEPIAAPTESGWCATHSERDSGYEETCGPKTETEPPPIINDPFVCNKPHTGERFDPTKSRLLCPERVKADKKFAAARKEFIEEFGWDPWDEDGNLDLGNGGSGSGGGGGGSGSGGCVWAPTINRDWHDDYVCGGVRQYFLPDDSFVERWEIDAAAQEWEARNG